MRIVNFSILLFLFFQTSYSKSVENSPAYGYHLKVGVPEARRILLKESWRSSRIVGGSQVSNANVIPYQVGIIATLTGGASSICGGSLISRTRVLTAAHCWFDGQTRATQFTIVLGSLTIFTGGTRLTTSDVTMHPSWNYLLNDIAFVRISAVTLSTTIQLIALPTTAETNQRFEGVNALISGFGKTSDAQMTFPTSTALHQATVPVISNAVCQNSFKITIDSSHICTAGTGGRGTCDGDSGGPLTVVHNNRRILIGVVSFGPGEGCQASAPSVFTRVTSFLPWINSNL
ncbi:brachyurin [Helicoverpa armigera]|uniref:brachyurin n=1 Tax=Helicoverpa armigera TaxID=29058 RepID=UPI003083866E